MIMEDENGLGSNLGDCGAAFEERKQQQQYCDEGIEAMGNSDKDTFSPEHYYRANGDHMESSAL